MAKEEEAKEAESEALEEEPERVAKEEAKQELAEASAKEEAKQNEIKELAPKFADFTHLMEKEHEAQRVANKKEAQQKANQTAPLGPFRGSAYPRRRTYLSRTKRSPGKRPSALQSRKLICAMQRMKLSARSSRRLQQHTASTCGRWGA